MYKADDLINENTVIVFIIWASVLTVIIILLLIWLVRESRITVVEEKTTENVYEKIDSLPRPPSMAPAISQTNPYVEYQQQPYIQDAPYGRMSMVPYSMPMAPNGTSSVAPNGTMPRSVYIE